MKEHSLVIASNFLDHYMLSQSEELMKYFKDFYFVASEKLADNYQKLGFSDLNNSNFVIKAYENKDKAREVILNADVVITGSYKYQKHIRARINEGKLVFYYSERLFKNTNSFGKFLRYIKYNFRNRYDNKSLLLCVSAYAAGDYNEIGLFKDRTYKWGYFPKVKKYKNIVELINSKKEKSIIWVGRLVSWKHPDDVVKIAKMLKDEKYSFKIKMIGNGEMKDQIIDSINSSNLNDCIELFSDGMSPENVRKNMEKSQIYLFTSDYGEGWGVVLNEAMNSACACVASECAGSTPFLIENNVNGFKYNYKNIDELYVRVKELLDNKEMSKKISINAYNTILNYWNAEEAAKRFYLLVDAIYKKEDIGNIFDKGILSKV